jgi:hypothetical protein
VQGDFSQTMVGDESDTSPFRDGEIKGISTAAYIRNMSLLIHALGEWEQERTAGEKK